MARLLLLPLVLALLAVARAQLNGTQCFLQTECATCVIVPGCSFCVESRACADTTSINSYCLLKYPNTFTIASSDANAVEECAAVPKAQEKACLDTDVNLTNGQLAGIIVGVILATAIIVPGAIVIVFFIFKAVSS